MKAVLPKDRKGAVEDVLATHRGCQSELSHVEVKVRRERAGLQIVSRSSRSAACRRPRTMDGASNTNEMMRHTTTVVASGRKPDGERNDEGYDRKGKNEITDVVCEQCPRNSTSPPNLIGGIQASLFIRYRVLHGTSGTATIGDPSPHYRSTERRNAVNTETLQQLATAPRRSRTRDTCCHSQVHLQRFVPADLSEPSQKFFMLLAAPERLLSECRPQRSTDPRSVLELNS